MKIPADALHRLPCAVRTTASVIVLHGWAARAAVHVDECRTFVDEHTEVVLPDAPGHGNREDGRVARVLALPDDERRTAIYTIAHEWAGELPALAEQCRRRGAERVGLVGISMGGYAALAATAERGTFDAIAALLAAPHLVEASQVTPGDPPILLGLAGRDTAVDPAPGRRFARAVRAELHEYPESGHLMRGADWRDLWERTATFLRRHLRHG